MHVDKSQLPPDYVWSRAELTEAPDSLWVENISSITSSQAAGASWARTMDQLAVRVPSVVIPEEYNILLNPSHSAYRSVVWSDPRPFRFDPRLFTTEPRIL